jgi:hypothetical protein
MVYWPKVDTAWAHKAIKPPGKMPKTKTKAPLMDKTVRTSVLPPTASVWVGASKYMTLTTRK